jgi:hypothetical protein
MLRVELMVEVVVVVVVVVVEVILKQMNTPLHKIMKIKNKITAKSDDLETRKNKQQTAISIQNELTIPDQAGALYGQQPIVRAPAHGNRQRIRQDTQDILNLQYPGITHEPGTEIMCTTRHRHPTPHEAAYDTPACS